jgi:hypothetical protein
MLSGVCKFCTCTNDRACAGGCCWIDREETICSACVRKLDDADLLKLATEDIVAIAAERVEFYMQFDAATLFSLASIVQLAKRHPNFPSKPGGVAGAATSFLDQIREAFDGSPALMELLRRGEDPQHDLTVEPAKTPAPSIIIA